MTAPPESTAQAETAPRRAIVCASSKLVMPTLEPGRPPSTATSSSRPSASWPTAARASRSATWSLVKSSPERKIALPARTSTGPPPSPETTPAHDGRSSRRVVTVVAARASAWRGATAEPVACRIAPSGGIPSPPPAPVAATTACRSVPGTAAGNGSSTTSADPLATGAVGP